jgi:hypothetical protein
MAFMRHVGKHGDRKVAVVFREVPGEPHMALVVYTEILNRTIHDPLIQCIESDIGQNSEDLALALNRSYTTDGQIILQKLHAEGMLKKVQTELIVMTPQPNTRIKLNELNKILDQMKMGEDAVKKLAEMDDQLGMQDPMAVARRMRGDKDAFTPETIPGNKQAPAGIDVVGDLLGDEALASNLRTQAERMSNEAKGLLAEAQRLIDQASGLDPAARSISKASIDTTAGPAKKTRGRPKKTLAA